MLRPNRGSLPHQVPLFPGETLTSYVRRTAVANVIDIETTDKAFREQGYFKSHAPNDELRRQTWVEYTGLPEDSFTDPIHLAGEAITERTMCTECTGGEIVRARTPDVGWVCIEHKRWLDSPQVVLPTDSPLLVAEERFRTVLVMREKLHDSLVMRFAETCAAVTHTESDLRVLTRGEITKATYVNTVRFAELLTSPPFLFSTISLHLDGANAVEAIRRKVVDIVGDTDEEMLFRAVNRIADQTRKLADMVYRELNDGYMFSSDDPLNLRCHFTLDMVREYTKQINADKLEANPT